MPAGVPLSRPRSEGKYRPFWVPSAADVGWSAVTPSSTNVTTGGTSTTKGAWTQLIASTAAEVDGLMLMVNNNSSTVDSSGVMDVGIGGAGSEVVVVENIDIGYSEADTRSPGIPIPVRIPAGSRVSVRMQSARTSTAIAVTVLGALTASPWDQRANELPTSLVTLGMTEATNTSTVLTSPGVPTNTKGAWTEIVAATTVPLMGIVLRPGGGGQGGSMAAPAVLVDVGYGPSGSEQVVVGNVQIQYTTTEVIRPRTAVGPYPVDIPAGARIVARYAHSANTGVVSLSLLGVPG